MIEQARELDAADPLARWRDRFELPEGLIYLDGNSLGALPKSTPARIEQVVREEWGRDLIKSWNNTERGGDWITLPQRVGARIAPLIGAEADEVIVADSVSVNLFKLISAALKMQAQKGKAGRKVILSEPGNFPTDLYMIQGLETQGLATQRLADRREIIAALGDDVALLLLTHVHYKTGEMFDMAALTKAAHDAGALVLWDLSHSGGAVPVDLYGCNADFAVGCGYKYLCGGPGAPAYAYVAKRHHEALEQPLSGWKGHAQPFAFEDDYAPAPGVDRLLCGTAPILAVTALDEGVKLIAEIGAEALWAKSRALSEFFRECLKAHDIDLSLVGPDDPMQRGSQLSFRHEHAYAICQALIARGVIGDFRAPDTLRLGFAPAYLRFEDMARAAQALTDVLESREYERPEFNERAAVT